jgi:hypothetical protein
MTQALWMAFVRHVIAAVGVWVMAMGYIDEATWTSISGLAMTLAMFAWSWKDKKDRE